MWLSARFRAFLCIYLPNPQEFTLITKTVSVFADRLLSGAGYAAMSLGGLSASADDMSYECQFHSYSGDICIDILQLRLRPVSCISRSWSCMSARCGTIDGETGTVLPRDLSPVPSA